MIGREEDVDAGLNPDHIVLPYLVLDDRGKIIGINQAGLEELKIERNDLKDRYFSSILTPGSSRTFEENFSIFKLRGKIKNSIFEVKPKRGKPFLMSFDAKGQYDSSGNFVQAHCFLRNVSQEINQKVLTETILQHLPLGVQVFDRDGFSLKMNKKHAELLGIKDPNLGLGVFNVLHDPYAVKNGSSEFYLHVYRSKKSDVRNFELDFGDTANHWKTLDGKRYFREFVFPVLDDEGEINFVASVLEDLTQHHKEELQLQVSEMKYRSLINAMQEGVVLHNSKGEIITCNQAAEQILGLSLAQMKGTTSTDSRWKTVRENGDFFPGEEHPAMVSLRSGKPQSNVLMGVHKADGQFAWISVNSKPIFVTQKDKPEMVMATFTDITDIKTSEKRLQELNSHKDQMFNVIGHDLKNPFQQLTRLSQLLKDSIQQQNWEDSTLYAQMMGKASSNGNNLLNNLLDWSRIQTNKELYVEQKFDLEDVVRSVFSLLKPDAHRKSLDLIRKNQLDGQGLVKADYNMVTTILRNLISNAIKFSFKGKSVEVTVEAFSDTQWVISIRDEGVGINAKDQDKIFGDGGYSTVGTDNEKGSGLGLQLVKNFVERNQGQIWFESTYGKGSTFYFTLLKG